jgi:hypothetical protein
MTELVARTLVDGQERHLVIIEEVYSDAGEPWTLFVNADHYDVGRRTLDKAYYWDLNAAQVDCLDRYGVHAEDWLAGDGIRFPKVFRFDYSVTHQGAPQPYPREFDGAEVFFGLDKAEHADGPSTPVLNISGNPEGLRRLAALLILCAESERYDARFHVHLDRESGAPGERAFLTGDLDVTLRAPAYLADLKEGLFREQNTVVDVTDESDESDEPWKSRPDA